jgi:hypothetical protein
MPTVPFPCPATPLTDAAFASALTTLGIDAPTLWSMLRVESAQGGFFADRRPQILYERHIFSSLTAHQYDATNPDLSNPVPGGYIGGTAEYGRLGEAAALDLDHALMSASWGMGQVLGENYALGKFTGVEPMIEAMCGGEDAQLQMMVNFVLGNHLATALQNHDWASYARGYNGPNYVKYHYDTSLAAFYAQYSAGTLPDIGVRAAQLLLRYLGFSTIVLDGQIGPNTLLQLHRFQSENGIALTEGIDTDVLASIQAALPAAVNLNLG